MIRLLLCLAVGSEAAWTNRDSLNEQQAMDVQRVEGSLGTTYNTSQQAVIIQEIPTIERSRNKTNAHTSKGVAGTRLHSGLSSSPYHTIEDAARSTEKLTLEVEAVERMKSYWRVGIYFGAICLVMSTIMAILSYLFPKAIETYVCG
mmetsp:Transcript_31893/g.54009  ORF Transcript_31893/g.54009 Transcript_31893/m.54009 type:complete len:147 (-) Transcript_31893:324-764(-)